MDIPTEPKDATAWGLLTGNGIGRHWLTQELNRAGFEGRITAIDPTVVGTGQVGENVRCRLTWDHEPDHQGDREPARSATTGRSGDDHPHSVVIKLASSNEESRAAAEATSTYIREVGFYRDLADSVAIRVPKAHHVSEDRAANRFILVMEDIAPAEAGNQLSGCSPERAGLAVEAAADLHGSTWGRPDIAGFDWIDDDPEDRATGSIELFRMFYAGFADRYQSRLSAEQVAFGSWLESNFDRWIAARPEPRCLVHGDFRLDNMLFGTGDPAPPLTTVDWQTPSLGDGLSDLAYFLSGSLPPDELRQQEADYLAAYRARLAVHGVELSADAAWSGYRFAAPAGFVMAVIASQLVGRTDRGDDMFMVMAAGSAAQALALDTAAVIG